MPHASPTSIRELSQRPPEPDAFRAFVEGMERFNNYLRSDNGEELQAASKAFASATQADPSFILARFHQAVAFAHSRKEDDAIKIFEEIIVQSPPFLPEIYYNLAQARLHTYRYDQALKAEAAFNTAENLAKGHEKRYLLYLARASRVLLYAVLGGRQLRHAEDFEERKKKYLPIGAAQGKDVLGEHWAFLSLSRSELDDVRVEAHNGLGAIYMRMGQYAELLTDAQKMWNKSERHYRACLEIRPTLTPTLHNLGTLHRLQGQRALQSGNTEEARRQFTTARNFYVDSLRINSYDQFPYYGASACSVYLQDWTTALEYHQIGQQQHGQVRAELWARLEQAISQKDPTLLAPEESGES